MPVFSGGRRVQARPVRPSFRDPRFAFLLVGQSVSWVASWAASIVLWGFAAYHFGASPEAISVTALCWSGPPVVLTAFTGGLTDRFGPRAMLIAGYLCSGATSLGMATAGSLLFLDVMAAACGAARALCTPASSALPARVVTPDDLLAVLPLPVLPLPEEPHVAATSPAHQVPRLRRVTAAMVTGLALPVIRCRLPATRPAVRLLAAGAISYGLAAALYTGTPWIPVAYLGAFAWGTGGTVFYAIAATTLQRLAPAGTLGRAAGVISTAESAAESGSMPAAGALVAVVGLRAGAFALAAVAIAAGAACLPGIRELDCAHPRPPHTTVHERLPPTADPRPRTARPDDT